METAISEKEAVTIVATLDTTTPHYQEAVEIALSRRGTRDALIVTFARQNKWDKVLEVFHSLKSGNVETNTNISAVYATAHALAGSTAIAAAISRNHPNHKMLHLTGQIIERKIPMEQWVARMAGLELDTCYSYKD